MQTHGGSAATATGTQNESGWTAVLDDALARLPDAERGVVLLRYLQGQSLTETAAQLAITPAAVAKRAERALGRMRAFFQSRGFAVTVAQAAGAMAEQVTPLTAMQSIALNKAAGGGTGAAVSLAGASGGTLTIGKLLAIAGATLLGVGLVAGVVAVLHRPATMVAATTPAAVPNGSAPPASAVATSPAVAKVSFDDADKSADSFAKALAARDSIGVVGMLDQPTPDAARAQADKLIGELRDTAYARFPQRLTQRVGASRNENMDHLPLYSIIDLASPMDADPNHLRLCLGRWAVRGR